MDNEEGKQRSDNQSQNSVIELDDKNIVFLNVYYIHNSWKETTL